MRTEQAYAFGIRLARRQILRREATQNPLLTRAVVVRLAFPRGENHLPISGTPMPASSRGTMRIVDDDAVGEGGDERERSTSDGALSHSVAAAVFV